MDFTSSLAAMGTAAGALFSPVTLLYLCMGVGVGTVLSVIPGVGGLMGIALLLPFTFTMDVNAAMVFLLAALAVMSTADTIPAVLFGVPGTPTSMATVLDGHPMVQRGEAGRALGAAFLSSVFGGTIGALVLLLVIPFIVPLLMATWSPELLGLCLMGLAMVAALSGGSMVKGLGAAAVGVMLALVGDEPTTAASRWTFRTLYLADGIGLLIIALGIYALPEVADMAIQGKSIAAEHARQHGVMHGARRGLLDTLKHWKLVVGSSSLSTLLGALPAVGPTIIPWIVYSMTTTFTRGPSNFGKGDVRGVIASESSNNATVGGALLPTVAVGVPGSAPMALFLGGMLLHGVAPGPDMLTKHLDMTYLMVWAIVLANIIGGALAYMMAGQLARVVFVRAAILVPMISAVVVVGAVQSSRQWADLLFLLLVGALGWVMKRARWARAPMFLAFILTPLVERYYHISVNLHGAQWATKPAVAVMLALTVLFLLGVALVRIRKTVRRGAAGPRRLRPVWNIDSGFALAVLAAALASAWWVPVAPPTATQHEGMHYDLETDFGGLSKRDIGLRALKYLALWPLW
ncbi:MAG: tripartite tricarboxylate transporter permease [Rubrivivax sp.]|nr:tripartite tricarboxylate transporter permease [Rubrivivax sp.]